MSNPNLKALIWFFSSDGSEINGHYYHVEKTALSYHDAILNCKNFGSNEELFEPTNASVTEKVLEFAFKKLLHQDSDPKVWIGVHDMTNEGTFTYQSDGLLIFENWNAGEPNDYGSGEDCVEARYSNDGRWNDIPCTGDPRPSICKRGM